MNKNEFKQIYDRLKNEIYFLNGIECKLDDILFSFVPTKNGVESEAYEKTVKNMGGQYFGVNHPANDSVNFTDLSFNSVMKLLDVNNVI